MRRVNKFDTVKNPVLGARCEAVAKFDSWLNALAEEKMKLEELPPDDQLTPSDLLAFAMLKRAPD